MRFGFRKSAARRLELLEQAREFERQGLLPEAGIAAEALLKMEPTQSEYLHLAANIAWRSHDYDRGMKFYSVIIASGAANAHDYFRHANGLKNRGEFKAALADYDRATSLDPNFAAAYCNRGVVLESLDQIGAALQSFERAIALEPLDSLAHFNRGSVLHRLGRSEAALGSFAEAIRVKPGYAEAHCNCGVVHMDLEQWEEARECFDRSIQANARFAVAYFNRAALRHKRKCWTEAMQDYDQALSLEPSYLQALRGRGVLYGQLGLWSMALQDLTKAIGLDANFAAAYCARGNVFASLLRDAVALADFDKALDLKPEYGEALLGRAALHERMRRFDLAVVDYERTLSIEPDARFTPGMSCHAKMNICDWQNLDSDVRCIAAGLETRAAVSPPFPVLALLDYPGLQRRAAEIWVSEECPADASLGSVPIRAPSGKIRIGYFSSDFRPHPVALLIPSLIEGHDRSRFEVFGFAFGADSQDPVRQRLKAAFDRFIDVDGKTHTEVAALARDLGIDIAVDLGGFTVDSPTKVFALRAAPLQISYLGYLGTMGAPYIDYLLADSVLIPESSRSYYSEKIIYLPSYQANDSKRKISKQEFSRAELGLPVEGFVYSCFNATYKLTPQVFDTWMNILRRVGGSCLFLYVDNSIAQRNLRKHAEGHGIAAERLVFGDRIPLERYLARFCAMDLFLDTMPYNAGTTASDALWAGLPVLTCLGESFAGRMAASLLTAIGLPELITKSLAEYEELAVRLALHAEEMRSLRDKLALNKATARLFDTSSFTKSIESAYTQIYKRLQENLPPEHVYPEEN